jgi:aspartate-semialdehyde dehydrogenase
MEPDVPLVVPEVNGAHLALVDHQRRARVWDGALVCNPNCTTAVLVAALAPLEAAFGIEAVACTSMQAVSGAGVAGLEAEHLAANVVPHIRGEEEKLERETARILGSLEGDPDGVGELSIEPLELPVSAACHRVGVRVGHTISVALCLRGRPTPEAVREALASFRSDGTEGLPSAPARPLVVHDDLDRPQPRLDAESDAGMPVHVGRVRPCAVLGTRFVVMGHNLERGAAGGSVLNAELWLRRTRGW